MQQQVTPPRPVREGSHKMVSPEVDPSISHWRHSRRSVQQPQRPSSHHGIDSSFGSPASGNAPAINQSIPQPSKIQNESSPDFSPSFTAHPSGLSIRSPLLTVTPVAQRTLSPQDWESQPVRQSRKRQNQKASTSGSSVDSVKIAETQQGTALEAHSNSTTTTPPSSFRRQLSSNSLKYAKSLPKSNIFPAVPLQQRESAIQPAAAGKVCNSGDEAPLPNHIAAETKIQLLPQADFSQALNWLTKSLQVRLAGAVIGRVFWRRQAHRSSLDRVQEAFRKLQFIAATARHELAIMQAKETGEEEVRKTKQYFNGVFSGLKEKLESLAERQTRVRGHMIKIADRIASARLLRKILVKWKLSTCQIRTLREAFCRLGRVRTRHQIRGAFYQFRLYAHQSLQRALAASRVQNVEAQIELKLANERYTEHLKEVEESHALAHQTVGRFSAEMCKLRVKAGLSCLRGVMRSHNVRTMGRAFSVLQNVARKQHWRKIFTRSAPPRR
eukprot:INCI713.2.p1 GENE.INCI713.2~~INCI713.2.p1  ORF type:complete len:499 (+),score=49.01 INCI713.2:233-1729(+)